MVFKVFISKYILDNQRTKLIMDWGLG